jgi:hypothetical protein
MLLDRFSEFMAADTAAVGPSLLTSSAPSATPSRSSTRRTCASSQHGVCCYTSCKRPSAAS